MNTPDSSLVAALSAVPPEEVAATREATRSVFVARQPIFDARMGVYAYELLFRGGLENVCRGIEAREAAERTMHSAFFTFGLGALTEDRLSFVNVPEDLLVSGVTEALPKGRVVLELLETVRPTDQVLDACRRLKADGYLIALDDFVYDEALEPLIELADLVKVVIRGSDREAWAQAADRLLPRNVQLLAEQVETRHEFDEVKRLGYTHFQGYFFCRPEVMASKEVDGFKLNYLRLLQTLHRPGLSYDEVEEVIKRDVSITHKLLRYLNSPHFGFRSQIESIGHALVLLGERDVRRWVSLITLGRIGRDKPHELLVTSTMRAKLCELLAPVVGMEHAASSLFLLGAFSVIDALLDRPMADVLAQLPLSVELKEALKGAQTPHRAVLDLVLSYERGDWPAYTEAVALLGMPESAVPRLYVDAIEWTRETFAFSG